jgi:hypothetical protein
MKRELAAAREEPEGKKKRKEEQEQEQVNEQDNDLTRFQKEAMFRQLMEYKRESAFLCSESAQKRRELNESRIAFNKILGIWSQVWMNSLLMKL